MRRTLDGRDLYDRQWGFPKPPSYQTQTQNPNTLLGNPMYQTNGIFQNRSLSSTRFYQNPNPNSMSDIEAAFARCTLGAAPSVPDGGFARLYVNEDQLPLNMMRSFSASAGLDLPYETLVDGGAGRNMTGLYSQRLNQSLAELGRGTFQPMRHNKYNTNRHLGSRLRSLYGLETRGEGYSHTRIGGQGMYTSLDQVVGRVADVATDQEGCRFLQKMLEERKSDYVCTIFLEVKDHIGYLMVDQFGNFLIQKLFEICTDDQMTHLLLSLIEVGRDLSRICSHPLGTRSMQKMIRRLTTQDQRLLLVSALKHFAVTLTMNSNGHHVIQQCLIHFAYEDTEILVKEIAEHCIEIAMDKSGCCVLQQAIAKSEGQINDRLVDKIISNAVLLSEHPYGNYVVQFTLALKLPHATAGILHSLRGSYVTLSLNKYGSNVVEKCLKECEKGDAPMIISELMASSHDFLSVLQDQYGKFHQFHYLKKKPRTKNLDLEGNSLRRRRRLPPPSFPFFPSSSPFSLPPFLPNRSPTLPTPVVAACSHGPFGGQIWILLVETLPMVLPRRRHRPPLPVWPNCRRPFQS